MTRLLDSKFKKVAADMLINLIGTGFPLFALQIIIYPIVAQKIDSEAYGAMQSIMSIVYLIGGTLGGSLSTTRLIREYEYNDSQIEGDYNWLLAVNGLICSVFACLVMVAYLDDISIYEIVLTIIVSFLVYFQNYLDVGFRLQLNYKRIFICKVLSCAGYIIGFIVFLYTLDWQYIFIGSLTVTSIYSILKTSLLEEVKCRTILFRGTLKSFFNLCIASLMSKALTYFDKLMLYPILGGTAVSVYFAANIFGKLIIQILEPITNVILSYLSRRKNVSGGIWKLTAVVGGGFCIIAYFGCLLVSKPILHIFYPQWMEAALELVPYATASLAVSSFISIIYPLALKTIDTGKQIIINGLSLVIYIVLVLALYKSYGLVGCCIALLISYCIRLLILVFFCINKKDEDDGIRNTKI